MGVRGGVRQQINEGGSTEMRVRSAGGGTKKKNAVPKTGLPSDINCLREALMGKRRLRGRGGVAETDEDKEGS